MTVSVSSFDVAERPGDWARRALWVVPVAHAVLWVALPSLLEGSLRLDAAEGASGGPEWQLSYVRHPPLSEWLTALAWHAGPLRYVALYAISQILVLISVLVASAEIARREGAAPALIATLAALASPFATYIPVQLNHNIGVLPFWTLVIVTGWSAFNAGRIGPWLLFGLSVGGGLWAKYSILHLVGPLGLAFLCVPEWRAKLRTPGPWLAALLAVVIIAPHALDVWAKGFTTLEHAMRHEPMSWREAFGFAFNMSMNATLMFAFASLPFLAAAGPSAYARAVRAGFARATATPRDLFLHAAAFGPLLFVSLSPLVGIRPRPLWITPMIMPTIIWFAHQLQRVETLRTARAVATGGVMAATLAVIYALTILIPIQNGQPQYSTFDGRRLADIARAYWAENGEGPLVYLVSTRLVSERYVAGSLAFDLPFRTHTFENASRRFSPWIDEADVLRKGALVIGVPDIPDDFRVAGAPVVRKVTYQRPVLRGRPRKPITFGYVAPR